MMDDDMGVPASPSGHSRAEPEVSALRASVPNAEDCPLVLVEWLDSSQPVSCWQLREDVSVAAVRIASVGWLMRRDDDVLALAPNVGGLDGKAAAQCSGVIAIPACSVVQVSNLVESEDG